MAIAGAIFARKGVSNTTFRDIAKEAGMLSGSLYHYFPSKEVLLDEIIRTALDVDIERDKALAKSVSLEPEAAVRELFHRGLMFAHDHPDVAAIVQDSSKEFIGTEAHQLVRQRDRAVRQAWTRVLQRGVEAGTFRADLDVELALMAMMAVVIKAGGWSARRLAHHGNHCRHHVRPVPRRLSQPPLTREATATASPRDTAVLPSECLVQLRSGLQQGRCDQVKVATIWPERRGSLAWDYR